MARVLIIEDNEVDLLPLETILEEAGHTVHVASSGDEALEVFVTEGFDVVVTDLHMEPGHGLELIASLTAMVKDAAIIVVSGTGAAQLDMAVTLDARAALSKPIDPRGLRDAVESAIRG
jgi:CheY-like chemotaxis protein